MCIALEPSRQRGATLVELVLSIVIIGVAMAGVLTATLHVIGRSADPLLRLQAVTIAEAYLAEILQRPFGALLDSGPEPGESRSGYDDLSDYHGLDDVGARDQRGQAIAGLEGYRVQVSVETDTLAALPAKRVTVTVSHGDMDVPITLAGFRSDY